MEIKFIEKKIWTTFWISTGIIQFYYQTFSTDLESSLNYFS
jgi:hypothetical protein